LKVIWKCFDKNTFFPEFLLGDDIIAAPVLEQGQVKKDIYLPKGTWIDGNKNNGVPIIGPTWIRGYDAPLSVLPYFVRKK
jgi:alpha-glucosidase